MLHPEPNVARMAQHSVTHNNTHNTSNCELRLLEHVFPYPQCDQGHRRECICARLLPANQIKINLVLVTVLVIVTGIIIDIELIMLIVMEHT